MRLRIILISVLIIIVSITFGQRKVNSGFVFVDGKYINAPYIIYAEDMAIHINGIQITKQIQWIQKDKYAPENDVFVNYISDNLTIEEGYHTKESNGLHYIDAKLRYIYSHYPYEEAVIKVVEFYESLPWVESLTQNADGDYILENKLGETRNIIICGSIWERYSRIWGPEGSGPPTKSELNIRVHELEQRYRTRLEKGDLFLIFTNSFYEVSFAEKKAVNVFSEITRIMDSNQSDNQKIDDLITYGILPRAYRDLSVEFNDGYKINKKFKARVKKVNRKVINEHGPNSVKRLRKNVDLKIIQKKKDLMKNGMNNSLKVAGSKSHSPDGKLIYAGCSYTYDPAFSSFDVTETKTIIDHVKDQDFNATIIEYKDAVFDTLPGSLTYANLKNMKYADILYFACHGDKVANGSNFLLIQLKSAAQINAWSGNDTTMITPAFYGGPAANEWCGNAKPAWATANWKPFLDQSNAITFLSCCYSYEDGWAAACGGATAFGYNISTTGPACEYNNKHVLKRMNGTWGGGQKREALQAYNNMPAHKKQFRIQHNKLTTLCPSPHNWEPEDGDLVPDTGTGFFEVDTWCDGNVTADQVLTFSTSGNVVISNVHWEGSGKVAKVIFDWTGDACWEVEVTINHNKWQSWGAATSGYHKLDVDRKAPNTDDASYTFYSLDSLEMTMTSDDVSCHGESDGEATVSVTNGTPPYTYEWFPSGGSSATATGLEAGTYKVVVTDDNDCHGQKSITITEPAILNLLVYGTASIPYCIQDGPPSMTMTASASGGTAPYTYSWPGGSLTVSSSGTYSCTVTDANGCTKSWSALVRFIPILCSRDPNDIAGATGYEPGNWVSVNDVLPYTIRFENDPDFASAPAQKVVVTFPFDDNLNPFSFKLGNFGFGSFNFTVPPNSIFYSDRLDCVDSLGVFVDVLAGIDVTNNEAFWILESIDPLTGLPPTDALTGFLPVNDTVTHVGEGFVSYTVESKIISQTGDSIHATGEIVFDINESIFTNTWKNVIDAVPPTSVMDTFPSFSILPQVDLSWQAADDPGGVGVGSYDLYMSKDGAPFTLIMSNIDTAFYQFSGDINAIYEFYVLAIDHVGNREPDKIFGEGSIQMGEPSIAVLTPELFDIYCDNETILISWETNGVSDFLVAVSTDNGITFDSITTLIDPPVREYSWPISISSPGDSCIIRISNPNLSIIGLSDKFVISTSPVVNLGSDQIISLSDVITLDAGSGFSTYTWNDGTIDQLLDVFGAAGAGIYTYEIVVADNYGCMGTDQVNITVEASDTCTQDITLPAGWSMFSTYVYPHTPDIETVLNSVLSNIILAKDESGQVLWPFFGLNQIGNMIIGKGYQIKVNGSNLIQISGQCAIPENTILFFPSGWSIIGYLRQAPAPIAIMMSPLGSELLFIKNGDGNVFWPYFGVDMIGDMIPGEAYQINMLSSQTFSYPSNSMNFAKSDIISNFSSHYNSVYNTGLNMTLVIPKSSWEKLPVYGSEIGVYNTFNELVGHSVFTDANIALAVWGDDEYSERVDGLRDNEEFNIRIWNPESHEEYELLITEWETGNSEFVQNSYSIISKVEQGDIILDDKVILYQNNPNPFKESTIIRFYVPADMDVDIRIYSLLGKKVSEFNITGNYSKGIHDIEFRPGNLASGSYLCKLTTKLGLETQVLNILK